MHQLDQCINHLIFLKGFEPLSVPLHQCDPGEISIFNQVQYSLISNFTEVDVTRPGINQYILNNNM